jgi:hypothetical protein
MDLLHLDKARLTRQNGVFLKLILRKGKFMKKVVKEYRIEFSALLVFLLGIFLVLEQLEIRKTAKIWLASILASLRNWVVGSTFTSLKTYFKTFSLSDLLGWGLILLTIGFIIWRVRYRFLKSPHWTGTVCPECGGVLHRVHRTSWDKVVSKLFLPHARRYRCFTPGCGWSGLRHHLHHDHHRSEIEQSDSPEPQAA